MSSGDPAAGNTTEQPSTFEVGPHHLTREQVADVLCAALDPMSFYIQYWGHITEWIEPPVWIFQSEPILEEERGHYRQDYPVNPGGGLMILEDEEEAEPHLLNWDSVQTGLNIMAQKYPHHFADILSENSDAITGDVLIQCSVLGDIVYG